LIEEYKIKGDMLLNKKTEKGKIKKEYKEVKETYNRSFPAKHYNLVRFLSFWLQDEKARAYAVQKLNLKSGDIVLNPACGPGFDFDYILPKIGVKGKVIAVDYSQHMLALARKRARRRGWKNITFVQADAAKILWKNKFDAAVITLGLSVIPKWKTALRKIVAAVKPKGKIAIIDGKSPNIHLPLFNFLLKIFCHEICHLASADCTRKIIQEARIYLQKTKRKDFLFQGLYVLTGVKK